SQGTSARGSRIVQPNGGKARAKRIPETTPAAGVVQRERFNSGAAGGGERLLRAVGGPHEGSREYVPEPHPLPRLAVPLEDFGPNVLDHRKVLAGWPKILTDRDDVDGRVPQP